MKDLNKQRWVLGAALFVAAAGAVGRAPVAVAAPPNAAPGGAKHDPAREESKAQADIRYEQGKAYYRAGAFDLAIQEFLAGYELDPRVGVLFNVARAYEELKNRAQAITYYRRYLDKGAAATAAAEARARIVALERQIKEDEERQKAEAEERERQRQRDQTAPAAAAIAVAEAPRGAPALAGAGAGPSEVSVTAPPPGSPALARNLKISGVAAGALGVALAGVGVLFVVRGNKLNDDIRGEFERTHTWTNELTSKDNDRKSDNKLAVIAFVASGATVAAGAALYYLGWRESTRVPSVALTPAAGPGGWTSLALTMQF